MNRLVRVIEPKVFLCGLLGLLVALGTARFVVSKEPSSSDQELVAKVAARFFKVATPVEGWAWPPLVGISDEDDINAYATLQPVKPGEKPVVKGATVVWVDVPYTPENAATSGEPAGEKADEKSDAKATQGKAARQQPFMIFKQGFLDKFVKGREFFLAETFGHELSHILRGHVANSDASGNSLIARAFSREQETEADITGMQLALQADYPYDELIRGVREWRKISGTNSITGLASSHPGWTDRAERIDEQQSKLWSSISAFENGVYFLKSENYELAERCFTQVVKEMPGCYEAWANRGYCRLMKYCDKLDSDTIKDMGLNQVVVGGFYRRAGSIDDPRGGITEVDTKLWFDAVGDLREALRLNDTLILPKANLALAYLVDPSGKQPGRAHELYEQIIAALKKGNLEEEIDLNDYAALLVNAGVTELAGGDSKSAKKFFDQVVTMYKTAAKPLTTGPVQSAMLYSQANQMASSADAKDHQDAIKKFEEYLSSTSSALTWWKLAYDRYKELCEAEKVEPKTQLQLAQPRNLQYRPVVSLSVSDGKLITLNDTVTSVIELLGEGSKTPLIRRSNIHRRKYDNVGLELLCSERLIAIRMRNEKSPALILHSSGPGEVIKEVRVGMTFSDLEKLLEGETAAWDNRYGTQETVVYHYFSRLGFGVRVGDENKITEIIVAQLPAEATIK